MCSRISVVIGLSASLLFTSVEATQSSLEARLARLEQHLVHLRKTMLDQDLKISQLQSDVQELRGEKEVLGHQLEQIEQQQQDIYLDLDERLRQRGSTPAQADELLTLETTKPSNDTPETATDTAVETPATETVVVTAQPAKEDAEKNTTLPPETEKRPADSPEVMVIPAQAAQSSDADNEAQRYQQIFAQVQAGQYEKAIIEFQEFLMDNPHGDFADEAQYWLGEAQYALKKYNSALLTFNALLKRYPNSSKIPHSLLKIGYIYAEQNNPTQAQALFQRIKAQYPETAAARLAQERLQAMTQP
ncbi:MAG: tol-pal system protein YbgF [Pseudomonadota bacterium]|nr:tol-pal system protein YbgF [Pseudomonadota bacterium]